MTGVPAVACSSPATGIMIGGCRVMAGASSWADRSLVRDGTFYPSRSLSAAQRLAHYASRLPLAEVTTTYRFPPTPEVTRRWVSATPPGFTIDVRAWSLLSGAPTWPESLWPDLQGQVRPSRRGGAKLYRHRLPVQVVDECWERFRHALMPLSQGGRLGAVIVCFPTWFSPRPATWEELAALPARLAGFRVAVELNNARWFGGDTCEQTLGLLEESGLCFVCHDGGGPAGSVVAATADVAFVRFPGRARRWAKEVEAEGVEAEGVEAEGVEAEGHLLESEARRGPAPWSYRYSEAQLAAWVPAVRDLASGTSQVHLIMDNCWRTDAVDNASSLLELLAV